MVFEGKNSESKVLVVLKQIGLIILILMKLKTSAQTCKKWQVAGAALEETFDFWGYLAV